MNTLEFIAINFGFLLRLAIPIIATAFFVWFLRRLDARWQEDALREVTNLGGIAIPMAQLHCWDVHDCSPERRATCLAYNNSNIPCWEAHRRNGHLQEACQGCAFRKIKLSAAPTAG